MVLFETRSWNVEDLVFSGDFVVELPFWKMGMFLTLCFYVYKIMNLSPDLHAKSPLAARQIAAQFKEQNKRNSDEKLRNGTYCCIPKRHLVLREFFHLQLNLKFIPIHHLAWQVTSVSIKHLCSYTFMSSKKYHRSSSFTGYPINILQQSKQAFLSLFVWMIITVQPNDYCLRVIRWTLIPHLWHGRFLLASKSRCWCI